MKALASRHFQPGECPSRGLLCDCGSFAALIRSHGDYGSLWSDARQRELRHLYKDEVVARNWTALMFACAKGHSEAVLKLSQAPGVDLNAKSSPATSEKTAAHFALEYNEDLSCVNILLKTPGVDWNLRDGGGSVPLVQTIIKGELDLFKAVLSVPELDLNAKDSEGWTPLYWALKIMGSSVCKVGECEV